MIKWNNKYCDYYRHKYERCTDWYRPIIGIGRLFRRFVDNRYRPIFRTIADYWRRLVMFNILKSISIVFSSKTFMNHDSIDNLTVEQIVKKSNQQDQIKSHDKFTVIKASITSKWLFVQLLKSWLPKKKLRGLNNR